MTIPVFNRSNFTQVLVTIASSETLGILDTDYIEDYNGVDGQVTLRHESGVAFSVLMASVDGAQHEVFHGYADLAGMPNGVYQIQGKVRDVLGNVAVLSEVATIPSGATIEVLAFDLEPGQSHQQYIDLGPLTIIGVLSLSAPVISHTVIAVAAQRAI